MNRKMIAHILAKMLGVEALLLILPAIVGVIYQEKKCGVFSAADHPSDIDLFDRRKKKTEKFYHICERRNGSRSACVDFVVSVRSTSVFPVRLHTKLSGCILRNGIRFYDNRIINHAGC